MEGHEVDIDGRLQLSGQHLAHTCKEWGRRNENRERSERILLFRLTNLRNKRRFERRMETAGDDAEHHNP